MKKYPIYKFNAKWSQDGKQDPNYPNLHLGLKEGRIWNYTGFSKMFREEQTQEQLDLFINEWWSKFLETKDNIFNIEDLNLETKYVEHETFVGTWFAHQTFDDGQTDEEFLYEFEQFVNRYEYQQDRYEPGNHPENYHCLMGGYERFRWYSGSDEYNDVPCRCKYCKEAGMLRIAH